MGDYGLTLNHGNPSWRPPKQQSDSLLEGWASRSALWGSRHGIGEAIDRYMGLHAPLSSTTARANRLAALGIDEVEGARQSVLTYGKVLKLDNGHIAWKDLTWDRFQRQIKDNTYELRQSIKPGNLKNFFSGISFRDFCKEVLWKRNIAPIKALFSGSSQNFFMNLGYTLGVGITGFSVLKQTKEAYQTEKRQEDGSWQSRLRTYTQTLDTLIRKAVQSAGAWVAADVGMTIGRALIPIGSFPIGGILFGALSATLAAKGIEKCLEKET